MLVTFDAADAPGGLLLHERHGPDASGGLWRIHGSEVPSFARYPDQDDSDEVMVEEGKRPPGADH